MKFKNRWPRRPLHGSSSLLGWSRRLLLVMGVLASFYVGWALLDSGLYQCYQTWRFDQGLKNSKSTSKDHHVGLSVLPRFSEATGTVKTQSSGVGGLDTSPLGQIQISSIGLRAMILEGTDDRTLRRAVGHIPGTALPGEPGNMAIAGHRDTFFRPLRNIRTGDEITVATLNGSYRYRVDSTRVVEPENTAVLEASDDALLTLVTCYPFYLVGSAPQRFIVQGHRIAPEPTVDR